MMLFKAMVYVSHLPLPVNKPTSGRKGLFWLTVLVMDPHRGEGMEAGSFMVAGVCSWNLNLSKIRSRVNRK